MKYYLWLLIWGIVGMSTAFAQSSPTASQEKAPQKAYCEWSRYIQSSGGAIYVDPDGKLYRFSYSPGNKSHSLTDMLSLATTPTKALTNTNLTEKDMEGEYSRERSFLRQIPAEEWQSIVKLLPEASKGIMSVPQPGGSGNGSGMCRCFVLNEKNNKYQEVRLQVTGDWIYGNSSSSAKEIANWMESLIAAPKPKFGPPFATKVGQ
jgi:hypothetical protein